MATGDFQIDYAQWSTLILQPLDVGVFAPLKRALAAETDAALRLDAGRIPRVQWVEMCIRARERAPIKHKILSGWRSAGLSPLSPITVPAKLPTSLTDHTFSRCRCTSYSGRIPSRQSSSHQRVSNENRGHNPFGVGTSSALG